MKTTNYKNKLEQYKGQLSSINRLLNDEVTDNKKLSIDFIDAEMALHVITLVGRQTQEKLSFRIESLVTAALEYVFDNPYQFKVEFTTKNNRTQCELYFERDGFKADPIGDTGGSVLDIASLALRLAMWSLQTDRGSPVFILDEVTKHISVDLREKASEFMAEMCRRLGIQIVAVSHDESVIESSDNVIRVVKDGQYSKIEEVA